KILDTAGNEHAVYLPNVAGNESMPIGISGAAPGGPASIIPSRANRGSEKSSIRGALIGNTTGEAEQRVPDLVRPGVNGEGGQVRSGASGEIRIIDEQDGPAAHCCRLVHAKC